MKILKFIKPILCGAAILLPFACYAQWDDNIPLGAMPMQFNSSFAGEAETLRLNTVFSYEHKDNNRNINQAFGYHASLDRFIPAIRSGVGITVSRYSYQFKTRRSPDEDYNIDNENDVFGLVAAIAPKFSIRGKYTLSPSLDFGYRRGNNQMNFAPQYSNINNSLESRVGLLFNTQKYYVGYSVYLIRHYWYSNVKPLNQDKGFTSYLQVGYTFQRKADSKFSFTPQLVGAITEDFYGQLRLFVLPNFTFRYSHFIAGLNHTGIHIGYQNDRLRLMLSGIPWGYGGVGPFSSGNMAVRHIFKE